MRRVLEGLDNARPILFVHVALEEGVGAVECAGRKRWIASMLLDHVTVLVARSQDHTPIARLRAQLRTVAKCGKKPAATWSGAPSGCTTDTLLRSGRSMPLQFDLIPAPVKGRMFEWRGPKWRTVCAFTPTGEAQMEKGSKPKRETAVKAAIAKASAQSLQIKSIGALTFWRGMIFRKSDFHAFADQAPVIE